MQVIPNKPPKNFCTTNSTSHTKHTPIVLTLVHTLHIIAKNSIQHMKNKILNYCKWYPTKHQNYCTQTLPLIPNILHQLYSRWFTLCISLLPHTPTPTPHTPYILTPYAPYIHTTLHSIHNIRFNSDPPPHAHTRTTTSPSTLQLKYTHAWLAEMVHWPRLTTFINLLPSFLKWKRRLHNTA